MKPATLKLVLGDDAPARELTACKTALVIERDGSQITGFVVSKPSGEVAIIDRSACRWLTNQEMWNLMHPPH